MQRNKANTAYRGVQALADDAHHLYEQTKIANANFHLILAVPLCMFALNCQLQVVPVYAELKYVRTVFTA